MNRETILIVDDEPMLVQSLAMVLQRAKFKVITASNGKEGLLALKSNRSILLVLLDLDMPVMNGVEMLEKLRESDREIKVLIMTGRSSHEWAKKCADLAVNGYMEKPFNPQELIARIKELLGIME